jgi:hypothetical protein
MAEPFRLLITGSRDWEDEESVRFEIAGMTMLHPGLVIVHGACPSGADLFAAKAAADIGIRQEPHPAHWRVNGKLDRSAGFRRNAEMVALGADVCLAFIASCASATCQSRAWPHGSHGASNCADLAEKAGITVRRFTA